MGMDVHKRHVVVSVYDRHCKVAKAQVLMNELESYISGFQRKHRGAKIIAAYEAGFCGFSLQRRLAQLSLDVVVVNPADIPTSDKQRTTKSDRIDSDKLAQALRAESLTPIWIPDPELEGDRELVRYRLRLQDDLRSVRNQIKMRLYKHGIEMPSELEKSWSAKFRAWLSTAPLQTPESRQVYDLLLSELDERTRLYKQHVDRIQQLSALPRYADNVSLLRTIPGIGPLMSITLLTEVGPIHRFNSTDRLASFVGLVPMRNQSGSKDKPMPLQRRAHHVLRYMIIQCAWISVGTSKHFAEVYTRHSKSKPATKSIIVVARRLLNTAYAVLKSGEPYKEVEVKN
jgi:transposase